MPTNSHEQYHVRVDHFEMKSKVVTCTYAAIARPFAFQRVVTKRRRCRIIQEQFNGILCVFLILAR